MAVLTCRGCRFFRETDGVKYCINHRGLAVTDENGFCHHCEPIFHPFADEEFVKALQTIKEYCSYFKDSCRGCVAFGFCSHNFVGCPEHWPDIPVKGGAQNGNTNNHD